MGDVRQAMVAVGRRHVRMLLGGRGPPVLLLHGSPNNADSLRSLIEALRRDFLVLAPDSPGNGASDPLSASAADAADYADAVAALLDALGVAQVAVYGFHTGAVFAAELARRHPSRVTCVVCDGYPLWTLAEARELAGGYLPPLVPSADGSHLAAVWSRVIDQNWYFPWHMKATDRRIDGGVDDVQRLHTRAMELLEAGDHYRAPYAAALAADGEERLNELVVPTLLISTAQDTLRHHLDRVPDSPALTVRAVSDRRHAHRETRQWFTFHPPQSFDLRLLTSHRRFVDLPGGQLLVVGDPGATAVWFHDAGESSRQVPDDRSGSARTLSLDLPGHGLSTLAWLEDATELKTVLTRALNAADVDMDRCTFDGKGLGRQVADLIAGRRDEFESRPVDVPDIAPRWDGGHLQTAWHFCRFRTQYRPWTRRASGMRRNAPLPSPAVLHRMTLDVLCVGLETLRQTLPLGFEARLPKTSSEVQSDC